MTFLRITFRTIVTLCRVTLQIIGMLLTLIGCLLMALGLTLRICGGLMGGVLIVTRGLFRALAAFRA